MKIPSWSTFAIVPALLLIASIGPIRDSETPVTLSLIVIAVSIAVAIMSWAVLRLIDNFKSK